jgi:hypothetical protein
LPLAADTQAKVKMTRASAARDLEHRRAR